ncbi:sensor histidine kinase [Amorphus orientalis]|uniref:histidine kinase n=1 Tax=Amorphus orientalis TaxID=649198 RepID=A0AAE3VR11_9HYPH|nr:sensor histidine kinase [Amorphus orientalis]MDQ0316744.1 two-component system sensor histidine kinase ChvG [Amorphus orientalis]
MAVETDTYAAPKGQRRRRPLRFVGRVGRGVGRMLSTYVFSSVTRRILALNLVGLVALVSGTLYLNQFRAGLIDARVESLLIQGEIIAAAIAASATVDTDTISVDPERLLELQAGESVAPIDQGTHALDFPINPERVAPILRRLISPTKTRARIYDREGLLLLDSRHLYSRGQILRFDLPPPQESEPGPLERIWERLKGWTLHGDLPVYKEIGGANGKEYPEVERAVSGAPASVVRVNDKGELIVSVAVPIQRFRAVLGALLLSTQGGDIDSILRAERLAIVRVFLVSVGVMAVLSILMAGTIAGPIRRLAAAADRVRRGVRGRDAIPSFAERHDEIGDLGRALKEMTAALHNRIDAIEAFAADVAHELKNPLTSLRSAVETLPRAKTEESRERLLGIIQHDVRRLDRLISDISDASRLDAELARRDAEPVNLADLLEAVVELQRELARPQGIAIRLNVTNAGSRKARDAYYVNGHDSRLSQVFTNLIDNARSFSPEGGTITVTARRIDGDVEVVIDDCGSGITAEKIERIFERFYTDRPEVQGFGDNSGLGLSISRQIVEAHRGTISAENRPAENGAPGEVAGARFIVRLPALSQA